MKDLLLILVLFVIRVEPIKNMELYKIYQHVPIRRTERISQRNPSGDKAYMVYLRPAPFSTNLTLLSKGVCGGVIIHKLYILTSAVCIENATHFLVISGTHKWIPPEVLDNKCINNGAKKAVWKGTPKGNFYNGGKLDNIRWIVGDIAVVKVEDEFNFERKIRGCDFIPKKIVINKFGMDFEKGGTSASIVGWGSTERYRNVKMHSSQKPVSAVNLLEINVVQMTRTDCKEFWTERYSNSITDEIICTEDNENVNNECTDIDGKCRNAENSKEHKTNRIKRKMNSNISIAHTIVHDDVVKGGSSRGFCENDHGGALLVGEGKSAIVTGIMSACFTTNTTNKCSGPFFFTSVYKHQDLIIACGLDGVSGADCRNLMRTRKYAETFFNWTAHPVGPAISEVSNNINHRVYVQTPREPKWPHPSPTSSEDFITSKKPPLNRHLFIVFKNSSVTFNPSSYSQSTSQYPKKTNKINLSTLRSHHSSKFDPYTSKSDFSRSIYLKHTTGYHPYVPMLGPFISKSNSYSLKHDMKTPKYDIYTSKSSKYTLKLVAHYLKSNINRPNHLISTLQSDLYTPNDDMYSPKFHRYTPTYDMSISKSHMSTSKSHMSTSKSHMYTPKPQMSTSKSQMSTSIYHKFTPEIEDRLDSQNKIFDLLTVQLWNLRSKAKHKPRHPQNNNFKNKSIYLKNV